MERDLCAWRWTFLDIFINAAYQQKLANRIFQLIGNLKWVFCDLLLLISKVILKQFWTRIIVGLAAKDLEAV